MIDHIAQRTAIASAVPNATQTQRRTSAGDAQSAGQPGAQYDFASIFGAASDERGPRPTTGSPTPGPALTIQPLPQEILGVSAAKIQTAARISVSDPETVRSPSVVTTTTSTSTASATTTAAVTATTNAAAPASASTVTNPGIETLVSAIMDGSFKPTYVTDPSKLQEINPAGTSYMPNFYFASDQTAAQLAQLLGGKVVQMQPFGQDRGWSEPAANFIQLANGQTFNAADVAYYARCGAQGPAQLTADITQTINEGSAWTNYYQQGGQMPSFATGYVGPAITGMSYPSNMVGSDGTVINPAMQNSPSQGT